MSEQHEKISAMIDISEQVRSSDFGLSVLIMYEQAKHWLELEGTHLTDSNILKEMLRQAEAACSKDIKAEIKR
jgi:hypothetical protein